MTLTQVFTLSLIPTHPHTHSNTHIYSRFTHTQIKCTQYHIEWCCMIMPAALAEWHWCWPSHSFHSRKCPRLYFHWRKERFERREGWRAFGRSMSPRLEKAANGEASRKWSSVGGGTPDMERAGGGRLPREGWPSEEAVVCSGAESGAWGAIGRATRK